ncbi:MAG: hypothetical protein RIT27_869 [Pseudomonadota bacterium]|jgi:ABC-type uncharacterized transport system permease subunit
MNTAALGWITALCYLFALTRISWNCSPPLRSQFLLLAGLAVVLHALMLYSGMWNSTNGIQLGFFNAASLITWVIALLLLGAMLFKPVDNLAVALFPMAAIAVSAAAYFPNTRVLTLNTLPIGVSFHIVTSILAYSLLSLSALQALFVAMQDYYLHQHRPLKIMCWLPPLQTMEVLLFQIMGVGFVLLTISLSSGALFLENIFAQHLVHKTVLSLLAWLVFGVLLFGRWRYGWRGRKVIRWILMGFLILMFAYFGSKLVLELLLKRQ